MTITDSHCHPQFSQYDQDRKEVIKRALDAGIQMICVGTDLETSRKGIELAAEYDGIWATVGLHPNDNLNESFDEKAYEELLKMSKVVAMGEIGLDYYRTENPEDQKLQKERFIKQLELADKLKKPIILHCRDSKAGSTGRAYPQMIDILRNGYAKNGGVVHSYTGSLDDAKQFLNLGLCLGFNGIVTFAKQYDGVVKYASPDMILLETDAPYLTPEPYRGQRNEPAYIIEVAKKIAQLRGDKLENIETQTSENIRRLFFI
ncbi:MAG: TatD family hydrolase [Candidatus Yanofskybacteria bacterium]|nr:TatD family hydrolase [Candidatus Yanofskybacteria bacterium]